MLRSFGAVFFFLNDTVILRRDVETTGKNIEKKRQLRIQQVMESIPFFACLSDEELSDLEHIIEVKSFSKNQIILHEEDTPNYMYIVVSGKVKVAQVSQDGKEQILAIHGSGDFFGEMSLLDGKTSPATLIAMNDTRIALIARGDFERHVLGNDRALRELLSLLCSRLREAWMKIKVLRFGDAEYKVRAVLKLMSMQNGLKEQRGTLILLKLTHEDIADYASVSRETATRLLGRFLKDGEIEVLENKLILLRASFFEKTLFV